MSLARFDALPGGVALAGVLALCGPPSQAFEPQLGSKNFTPPSFVPNYFSNEAAPFGRGAQTAQPGADRFNTAPAAPSGGYAAAAEPSRNIAPSAGRASYRGTQARGRTGRVRSASSRTARVHVGTASAQSSGRVEQQGGIRARLAESGIPAFSRDHQSRRRGPAQPRRSRRRAGPTSLPLSRRGLLDRAGPPAI